jgi:protein disulfide-isomerase A6
VLLFTERKTTAPIMKALSKQYKDKLLMGEVRLSTEKIGLFEKFEIVKTPTLLVITDFEEFKGDVYNGELNIDQISKFLNNYEYKTVEKK